MISAKLFSFIFWDPRREIFIIQGINWPIMWYSIFFAIGFIIAYYIFLSILRRYLSIFEKSKDNIKKTSIVIADRLAIFVIIGTIIGARLGHVIFYEDFSYYLSNPIEIIKIWEGGLASHGATLGIMIALLLFTIYLRTITSKISWLHLFDLACIPVAVAGMFIRIGNFFNQEILGKQTTVFWAIIFGHPADGGPIVPRHPTQLYEALAYLVIFIFLFYLSYKPYFFKKDGKIIGLFLVLVFGSRFIIEFWKVKQSVLLANDSFLLMGQYLSLPFVFLGVIFFFWTQLFYKK